MPNWCNNQLYFTGNEVAVKEVKALFIEMMIKGNKTNEGQKTEFMAEVEQGYFFDIDAYENDDQISFSTKWASNTNDVLKIAQNWQGLDFELTYQERGSGVYGKATFKDGELTIMDLDDNGIEEIEYDEENDIYTFRGEESESEEDFLEQLFTQKFKQDY